MRAGIPDIANLRRLLAGAVCVLLATVASSAASRADVLSIGDDGSVTVHSGPALYTSPDLKPEALPAETPRVQHGRLGASPVLRRAIATAAARHALSPLLVSAVAWHESRFNADAVSPKGARGIMQLMPDTARSYCTASCSATDNVEAGTAYLQTLMQRYDGDLVKALAAYDAGPGAVDRFGGVPPFRETETYVDAILARMSAQALDGPN
ncbi:MAG TPA: lytic transglycosylase domain-containing protein [Rhizomicrobium sp.]|nr:lytic transglycosylase domain-containing protein [Rhizomicrobium sp.]